MVCIFNKNGGDKEKQKWEAGWNTERKKRRPKENWNQAIGGLLYERTFTFRSENQSVRQERMERNVWIQKWDFLVHAIQWIISVGKKSKE